ncbi:MAG: hypothetical protein I8H77_14425 [Comamonadaceae bacterium]|nr:hypothetical protein [Comamonadaceae bacterium]
MSTDRPVSLDLGVSQDAGFQTRPDNPMDTKPGKEHWKRPDAAQEQQLEEDAALLSKLLKAGDAAPNLPAPDVADSQVRDASMAEFGADARKANTSEADTPIPDTVAADGQEAGTMADDSQAAADTPIVKSRIVDAHSMYAHSTHSREKEPPHAPDAESVALRPFDLFTRSVTVAAPAPPVHAPAMAALESNLVHMARSLMVGEGVHGATIRLDLGSEHFPGVVLEVFKDQGTIVAQFVCANESSRTRLANATHWLSNSLSRGIGKDTLVRVTSDDPEDPHPVETRTQAVSG